MTNAISIHIGLNGVDPNAYNGWPGTLFGCVNDATDMQRIADALGYTSTIILNEEATADRIISEIGQAAWNLDPGGILMLTYSGHGGQVPDANGDEPDGLDETWVLYDRQLIDDELYNMWNQLPAGARVLVISDSCHSGTMTRDAFIAMSQAAPFAAHYRSRSGAPRFRGVPPEVGASNYQAHKPYYDAVQFASGSRTRGDMEACVLLISACQDNQVAGDGDTNGLFTGTLLNVWKDGDFAGNYRAFFNAIVQQMPSTQTPNYSVVGTGNPGFEGQQPFAPDTLQASGDANGAAWPAIKGPSVAQRQGPAPNFTVSAGPNRIWLVEVATRPDLFDISNHGSDRGDTNFYGSWSDTSLMQGASYHLPEPVWNRLHDADRLYYRLGSATDANYSNYQVSSGDMEGDRIPAIQIDG